MELLTEREFTRLAQARGLGRSRTTKALRLVFVNGESERDAARASGISEKAVARAVYRLTCPVCPACGQVVLDH
jgi:DNA-directed RNA polymerase specialized sigma24 family protein